MGQHTTINGVRLFWELSGDDGAPFVLVHGSWVDHRNWDALVPYLSPSFRVLAYDRRGHSQSERPSAPATIQDHVADLAGLIETLKLAPAHILGASMGASIVLRLASERPDLFRSMIVHEPPLLGLLRDMPGAQPMLAEVHGRIAAVLQRLAAGSHEDGARAFVEGVAFGPGAWEQVPTAVRETVIFNAPTFLADLHDPLAMTIDLDNLAAFSKPVLLTLGEQSPPFLRYGLERVSAVLPQAQWEVFAGVGHEPEVEQPDRYGAAVMDFVTGVGQLRPL